MVLASGKNIRKIPFDASDFTPNGEWTSVGKGAFGELFEVKYLKYGTDDADPEIAQYCDSNGMIGIKIPNGSEKLSERELFFNQKSKIGQGFDNGMILMKLFTSNNSADPAERCMNLGTMMVRLANNQLAKTNPALQDLYNNYPDIFFVKLIQSMSDAVDEVHDNGFKHLDIHGGNVLLVLDSDTDEIKAKVIDGGLAYSLDEVVPEENNSLWGRAKNDLNPDIKGLDRLNQYTDTMSMRVSMLGLMAISTAVARDKNGQCTMDEVSFCEYILHDPIMLGEIFQRARNEDTDTLQRYVTALHDVYLDPEYRDLEPPPTYAALQAVLMNHRDFLTQPNADASKRRSYL